LAGHAAAEVELGAVAAADFCVASAGGVLDEIGISVSWAKKGIFAVRDDRWFL